MNYQLVSALMKGLWAIEEDWALSQKPFLDSILLGSNPGGLQVITEFKKAEPVSKAYAVSAASSGAGKQNQFNVCIIPVQGPLMKQDQDCGPVGMRTMGQWIQQADANPSVDAIILDVDSPGGTVDGTLDLATIIHNTQKPVIAFTDGMIASGAYWLSSASDYIIASNKHAQIGSIGVMMSMVDPQPYWEKKGVAFHSLKADQSKDKNRLFADIRAGKYEEYIKTTLNPLADDFIKSVKEYRPGISEKALTGGVDFAPDALSKGLIDEIGSFERAIEKAMELAQGSSVSNSNTNSNKASMKTFPKIAAALAVESIESTNEGVFLNEQQLTVLEELITNAESSSATINELNTQVSALKGSVTEKETQITALTQQVANLKNGAAADDATLTPKGEITTEETPDEELAFLEKNGNDTLAVIEYYKSLKNK
jgi:protease-4